MKFLSTKFFIAALCIFLFHHCSKQTGTKPAIKTGGIYRIPITAEISSLDPVEGDVNVWEIGSQVFEGLVSYSNDGKDVVPLLAESFQQDSLNITFYLRRGIRFQNDPCFPGGIGREFTANDVKYSIERYFATDDQPEPVMDAIQGLNEFVEGKSVEISGLKVLSTYSFQVLLTHWEPTVLESFASFHLSVVAPEAVDYYGQDFPLHPVGTGPFRISELLPNEKLVLVKNTNYWGRKEGVNLPYLYAVEYIYYAPDQLEKKLLNFQTQKLDECGNDVSGLLQELAEIDSNGSLLLKGWLQQQGVQILRDRMFRHLRYLQIGGLPQKVRQAISFAVNRRKLVENQNNIFQHFEIAKGPIPPDSPCFSKINEGQYYDPEKAKSILKEAGYPNSQGLPVIPFISLPSLDVDLIIDDLEAVGFRIRKVNPFPGWRKLLKGGKPVLVRMQNITTSPSEHSQLEAFFQEECWKNTQFVDLYRKYHQAVQSPHEKKFCRQLEHILCDIAPVVFLYHIDGNFRFVQPYVRGRELNNAWGQKLNYVWLDR